VLYRSGISSQTVFQLETYLRHDYMH